MNIAIIGLGNVGLALAESLTRAGDTVIIGSRDESVAKNKQRLSDKSLDCEVVSNIQAVSRSDIVIFAVPWSGLQNAIVSCENLINKIVIDCSNPINSEHTELEIGFNTSGAEKAAEWAKGAYIFKTFNHTGAETQANPAKFENRPAMFVCGDSSAHKAPVMDLVTRIGFEAIDAGELSSARLLEPLAMLWIRLALKMGLGRNFAYSLLRA